LINGKVLYVFNKIDLISDDELVFLKKLYPKAIFTSAKKDFNFIDFLENIKEII
jgi:50S ribosomal subunit-associated GTPase HflX